MNNNHLKDQKILLKYDFLSILFDSPQILRQIIEDPEHGIIAYLSSKKYPIEFSNRYYAIPMVLRSFLVFPWKDNQTFILLMLGIINDVENVAKLFKNSCKTPKMKRFFDIWLNFLNTRLKTLSNINFNPDRNLRIHIEHMIDILRTAWIKQDFIVIINHNKQIKDVSFSKKK